MGPTKLPIAAPAAAPLATPIAPPPPKSCCIALCLVPVCTPTLPVATSEPPKDLAKLAPKPAIL